MGQDLAGKVAIITGGANGIGKASVELFVRHGARVVIADIQREPGERLAASAGENAHFVQTDVTSEQAWHDLIAAALNRFDAIDILFNNAGGGGIADVPYIERDFAQFMPTIAVNLLAPMLGMKLVGQHMVSRGAGAIVNCCSTAAFHPGIGIPFYRAAKGGLLQVSHSVALEFAPFGVRVNCVSPGPVTTDDFGTKMGLTGERARKVQEQIASGLLAMQAIKDPIQPADIAEAALYLASGRAARVTGHNLVVAAGSAVGDMVDHAKEMARSILGEDGGPRASA
jgi:NAD(P)-dependent dehydrogenase (short-subunit alcohol dehydrogenase family)